MSLSRQFVCLSLVLMAPALPALAGWEPLYEDEQLVYYIDPATKGDKPRPRVRILRDFKAPNEQGDQSAKLLYEADCASNKVRMMSGVYKKGKMGEGEVSGMINSSGWADAGARPVLTLIYNALCRDAASEPTPQMGRRISPADAD